VIISDLFVAPRSLYPVSCRNLLHIERRDFAVCCLALLFVPIPCSAQTTLAATPSSLNYSYTIGGPLGTFGALLPIQTFLVTSTNPSSGFAFGGSASCDNPALDIELQVGSTPFDSSVIIYPSGLPQGAYSCSVFFDAFNPVFGGPSAMVSVTLTVSAAPMPLPTVSALTCLLPSLSSGQSTTCTVLLSATAPSGGAVVNLSSSNPLLTVPGSVTFGAGSTSASFPASAGTISAAGAATITASYNSSSQINTIQLSAPAPLPTVSALPCLLPNLSSGQSTTCTVLLSATAPSGGAVVNLSSSNPLLTVPGSVTVGAGSTSASFTASAGTISAAGSATITASYNSSSKTNNIQLTATLPLATPVVNSLNPSSVTAGGPAFSLTVSGTGFALGATVSWNGLTLPTTFGNSTQLTASVPANLLQTAGTAAVTVQSSGGTSNSLSVYLYPTVGSLSPPNANAAGPAFTLTVNGTGYTSGTVAYWNGSPLSTTFGSAMQLTALVPANLITAPGTFPVMVIANSLGSSSIGFTVNPTTQSAPPAISSLSPSSVVEGQVSFALLVNGSGFTAGAVVLWNGSQLSTTFVSATQLTATVPASFVRTAGNAAITVVSGGSPSNSATFTINHGFSLNEAFSVPIRVSGSAQGGGVVTTPVPISSSGGGASQTVEGASSCGSLTVEGTGCPWLIVGPPVMAPGQLSVTIDTSSLMPGSYAGTVTFQCVGTPPCLPQTTTFEVTVVAPSPGNSLSVDLFPNSATAGGQAFTLSVPGSGFESGSTVYWAGSPLSTTYISLTRLTAAVAASLIALPGTANITVGNPGGASSPPVVFTMLPVSDSSISLSPNSMTEGGNAFTLSVTGSGFTSSSKVEWKGSPLSTTYVSPTELTASVPASLIASPGTASILVENPGGTNSLPATFTVSGSTQATTLSLTVTPNPAPAVSLAARQSQSILFTIDTTGSEAAGVAITATTSSGGSWLTPAVASINAPGTLNVTVDATGLSPGPYSGTVSFSCPGSSCGQTALTVSLTVLAGASGTSMPSINAGGVITSSSFGAARSIGPDTYVEIYGSNFSTTTLEWGNSFINGMAPTTLAGVSATINGQPAFVNYVSPGQVNILAPGNLSPGPGELILTNSSGSADYAVNVLAQQPELLAPAQFLINGLQYVGAILSDGVSFALPTGIAGGRPARPGETITTYGIGFLSVTPVVPAGNIAPSGLTSLKLPFQILFNQTAATYIYAGLAPGFVGLYQFDLMVPQIPDNDAVPVTFSLGGTPGSQTLYIPVHQ
jgi:uncharacterized protein (TIGR03437 family)